MNVLSLFSGIGGLELGLERAGMNVVGQVEISEFCRGVLQKHWPDVPRHDDVRTAVEWWESEPRPDVDLICGGYPCQPFSTAGKMLAAEDDRHLWPVFADIIRALRPRYALLENVATHVRLGLDRVLGDLSELGFDAEWSVVPAAAMGASHRRPRLFVLAYSHESELGRRGGLSAFPAGWGDGDRLADSHRCRTHLGGPTHAVSWAGEPDVGRMVDGVSSPVDGDRLHALGNAVVPQVAGHIGAQLLQALEMAA